MRRLLLTSLLFAPVTAFAQNPLQIAVISGNSDPACDQSVVDMLWCTGEFTQVDLYEASTSTPTPAEINTSTYDAVLVITDQTFANGDALGDTLYTFANSGGGVVLTAQTFSQAAGIGGLFVSQGLMPVTFGTVATSGAGELLYIPDTEDSYRTGPIDGHFLNYGANTCSLGSTGVHTNGVQLTALGQQLGTLSNGQLGAAVLEPPNATQGRIAAINLWGATDECNNDGVISDSDCDQLLAKALMWTTDWQYPVGSTFNEDIEQDLNCNLIDASEEVGLVDPGGEECENNIDPNTGYPYDNADFYWDYHSFECLYFIPDNNLDDDNDLLGGGQLQIFEDPPEPFPTEVIIFCDNCSDDYNPNQADRDLDPMTGEPDGVGDLCDNCPYVANDQMNSDNDCHGDACDNCPLTDNPDQSDTDGDGIGDACDNCPLIPNDQADFDYDGVGDACDNCIEIPNSGQENVDFDAWGDACDNCPDLPQVNQTDTDYDGFGDACDNCPGLYNTDLSDVDGDGVGDQCDNCPLTHNLDQNDADADDFGDACDNCPYFGNGDQQDTDGDLIGDVCDNCIEVENLLQADADTDGFGDACDNCPSRANETQQDSDDDGFGDVCDFCIQDPVEPGELNIDSDGDGFGDVCDNCPFDANPDQFDDDNDDLGNACDKQALRGGGEIGPHTESQCSHLGPAAPGAAIWLLGMLTLARRRRD